MSSDAHLAWRPNESSDAIATERCLLAGFLVSAVVYGINVTLFWTTLNLFLKRPRTGWKDYSWIAYVCLMFSICTIGNATQFKYAEVIFIYNREYPGGPSAFNERATETVGILCNSVYFIGIWIQDGLLLWRFMIICGRGVLALALPSLLYLGTLSMGCVMIANQVSHGASIHGDVIRPILTSYFSLSITFNIVLTLAIVTRLMLARRNYGILGAGPYVSVAAMLIESAVLYSMAGIAYLIAHGVDDGAQNTVLPVLAQLQTTAPLLIIMRVAQGHAWARDTGASLAVSTIRFAGHKPQRQTDGVELAEIDTATGRTGATVAQIVTFDRETSSETLAHKAEAV